MKEGEGVVKEEEVKEQRGMGRADGGSERNGREWRREGNRGRERRGRERSHSHICVTV